MKISALLYTVSTLFYCSQVFAQDPKQNNELTATQMEKMQKLMDNQAKTIERLTNTLPTMTGTLNSITKWGKKLEGVRKERHERVAKQTAALNKKTEEVLALIDNGKKTHAKIKALGIKWTPIGVGNIDSERSKHFDGIRKEVLKLTK